ncbi:hypothetical protein [Methanobacterium sp.]|uniref:hypothetical protein n=1 Tax=Methanobacterium sp. TaxID=2164 RepID=UPI0025EEBCD7|nr:hypothetical protein [Methanobacterium sp.]MBI5458940.1 hypothetical protein [Methanobacterium sp.]
MRDEQMNRDDLEKQLKPTKSDVGHAITKGALSTIPLVGGSAAEIFSLILEAPISKRRDEFIISIYEELQSISEKVEEFNIEELVENEIFITSLTHALPIAVKNHQIEKITALKNVVLNSTLPNAPDEDKQLMFLDFIDSFTSWHLKILLLFDDPEEYASQNDINFPNWSSGQLSGVVRHVFPELNGKREFYTQIFKDLYNHGLLNTSDDSFNTIMTGHGMLSPRTTELGSEFLIFIIDPQF